MIRRTVNFSEDLAWRIERVAAREDMSFSAAVLSLVERALRNDPLPYEGAGEGPGDLAERVDDYLQAQVEELKG